MHAQTQAFAARVAQLAQANAFVVSCLQHFKIDPDAEFKVLLALEEAFVNICHHAYDAGDGEIAITCTREHDAFVLAIADGGKPFDVLSLPDPDTTLGIEERPVGGLGLYLIRTLCSDVRYTRNENRNILRMVFDKQLPENP